MFLRNCFLLGLSFERYCMESIQEVFKLLIKFGMTQEFGLVVKFVIVYSPCILNLCFVIVLLMTLMYRFFFLYIQLHILLTNLVSLIFSKTFYYINFLENGYDCYLRSPLFSI